MNEIARKIVGRYELSGEIAAGGIGTVHHGRLIGPVGFSRPVAIKRLHPQYAKDPAFVSMFLDEAQLAASVHHPNVIPTLDVVVDEGELFVVMEYVRGQSFASLLSVAAAASEPIPAAIVRSIIVGALQGLHAAHEAVNEHGEPLRIVHRDVSPQNMLVGVDGVTRILDFGIAKAASRLNTTRDGRVKGKLRYMAPEQILSQPIDRRTDVYAMGIVLWEALAARPLFFGDTDAATLHNALHGAVVAPSSIARDAPEELDAIVIKALERNPDGRYPTALALAVAIEASGPVAGTRELGSWVQLFCPLPADRPRATPTELGAATVVTHAPILDAASSPGASASSAARSDTVQTQAGAASITVPARPSRKRGVVFAVALLMVGALFVGWRIQSAKSAAPVAPIASVTPDSAGSIATAAPSLSAPAAPPASALDVPQTSSSASAPPSATAARPSGAAGRAQTTPVPLGPTRARCNPPFVMGVDGLKRYKPECI